MKNIQIENDVYNISKRIKNINRDYYVVYNTSKNKFEVYNSSQIGSSYCLSLPFTQLDERTITHVRKTQSSNLDEILEQIENNNNIRESANYSAFSSVMDEIGNMEN